MTVTVNCIVYDGNTVSVIENCKLNFGSQCI